jgi:hypothetical protein
MCRCCACSRAMPSRCSTAALTAPAASSRPPSPAWAAARCWRASARTTPWNARLRAPCTCWPASPPTSAWTGWWKKPPSWAWPASPRCWPSAACSNSRASVPTKSWPTGRPWPWPRASSAAATACPPCTPPKHWPTGCRPSVIHCANAASATHATGAPQARAPAQGPPRRAGSVPLPAARSAARAGGRRAAPQGGVSFQRRG